MGFISWIIMGLVVGVLAKFIMPGKDPGGFIITILLGIAGSFMAKYATRQANCDTASFAGMTIIGMSNCQISNRTI